ncbi:MAG: hypothetical protein JO227_09070 [Acetobacteraceae bacterium]|nr:hypothetical protein [Acetobacteraceae bacterium]
MTAVNGASLSGYGVLGRLIDDSATVHRRLDQLTEQASSGRIADTFAGLGAGASTSLNLRPQINSLQTWQNNIDASDTRLQVTQTAVTQIQDIASNFNAQLNNLNGMSGSNVATIAASARSALQQVAGLLDSQAGQEYVFAGQDSGNPPVPNPDNILNSGLFKQIASAVSGLAANGAAATTASTLSIASSNAAGTSPFSAYMSQPASSLTAPIVQVGPNQFQSAGLLASSNTSVTSTGTSTTGSYMRDVLRALATIGSLDPSQVNAAGFGDLVQDTRTSLTGAINTMAADAGTLGNTQSAMDATKTQLQDVATTLTAQVSGVEDVDMAATLSNLTSVQTQLQASYQLIAGVSSLSLAKYLSAA